MVAFAYYKIRPSDWMKMSYVEFMLMWEAYLMLTIEEEDRLYVGYAWTTAQLMNASGNFKKQILPKDLYLGIHAEVEPRTAKDKAYVDSEKSKLSDLFGVRE